MLRWWTKRLSLAAAGALVFFAAGAARAEGWGTIKGQAVWDGDVPKPEKIDVSKNQDKEFCLSKGDIFKEENVVNPKNKGVRWVMVYLMHEKGFKTEIPIHPSLKKIKDKEVVIDQPCCKFEPHVVGVREGQTLVFKNSAPKPHNVRADGIPGPHINQIVPSGGKLPIEDLTPRQLPITITCDIHPWMSGRVFVLKHPYFAVTDADGKFEIKNAPAGTYRLVVWQQGMGWVAGDKQTPDKKGKKITIKANETTNVGKFKVKPSKD